MTTASLTLVQRSRIQIGHVPIDDVTFAQALDAIEALVKAGKGGTVHTPNVDHVVLAEKNERFRSAYQRASLSLVDGAPVLWASHLLGTPLPEKISGSDLLEPLMQRAAERRFRVYFLGGDPGVAEAAKNALRQKYAALDVVGVDDSRVEVDRVDPKIFQRIRQAQPQLLLVALGAPKQEIFAHEYRELLKPAVCVGVGASFDFVAGARKRAPRWVSRIGFEWLYRMAQEPRRLAARYLLRDPQFCWIVARQLLGIEAR